MLKIVNVILKQIAIQIQWITMDESTSTSILFSTIARKFMEKWKVWKITPSAKNLNEIFLGLDPTESLYALRIPNM